MLKSILNGPNNKEITLHDDDPDALEAMIRHLYNNWLRLPSLIVSTRAKMQFYCNVVVVVADKYDLPAPALEARNGSKTFLVSLKDPKTIVAFLKIMTQDYSDYSKLGYDTVTFANSHLKDLAAVTDFPSWLATQPDLCRQIVEDVAKLHSVPLLPTKKLKQDPKFKCVQEA
jgi:hypothetical protein